MHMGYTSLNHSVNYLHKFQQENLEAEKPKKGNYVILPKSQK